MPIDLAPLLAQGPYVAITIALVVYFQKLMQRVQDRCDERAGKRDEQFLEALTEHSRVIGQLSDAIARDRFERR